MAYEPRFTTTSAITAALARIERARGFLDAARVSDDWLARMQERAAVVESYHSTRIEGTQLTMDQAERLLAGEPAPDATPVDARELLNYREAFDLVATHLGDGAAITEHLISEIHRKLLAGVRGDSPTRGSWRDIDVRVAGRDGRTVYEPPRFEEVPGLMTELMDWLAGPGDTTPVLVAGIAQHRLVDIHPFEDGNGRTARLLSMLCLYRAGYDLKRLFSLSDYYDRDRDAYYDALQVVRERDGDLTPWLEYFTEGLAVQLREIRSVGEGVIGADLLVRQHGLGERQRLALEWLAERGSLTIGEFEGLVPGVDRRTLQRDLKGLVELGLIEAEGETRSRRYVPPGVS